MMEHIPPLIYLASSSHDEPFREVEQGPAWLACCHLVGHPVGRATFTSALICELCRREEVAMGPKQHIQYICPLAVSLHLWNC